MKCGDAKHLCCGHLDHELCHEEEAAFQRHLQECPQCANQVRQMEECVELLHGLPETDPGPDFYECVREKILAAEAGHLSLREADPPPAARLREWLGGLTLRTALAPAVWLMCGLLLGGGIVRLASQSGPSTGGFVAAEGAAITAAPEQAAVPIPSGGAVAGPFSDIDLAHLAAFADSSQRESEAEYLLEPYVPDPQRGLVPDYQRSVTGDRDAQNDVYTVF